MTIDISQFYQVFFDEAEELLAEMERLLLGDKAAESSKGGVTEHFLAEHGYLQR